MARTMQSCWKSFLPKTAASGSTMLKSLATTVATPRKKCGRVFPHNTLCRVSACTPHNAGQFRPTCSTGRLAGRWRQSSFCLNYNRTGEIELLNTKHSRYLKAYTITPMAQQHHHERDSQHSLSSLFYAAAYGQSTRACVIAAQPRGFVYSRQVQTLS